MCVHVCVWCVCVCVCVVYMCVYMCVCVCVCMFRLLLTSYNFKTLSKSGLKVYRRVVLGQGFIDFVKVKFSEKCALKRGGSSSGNLL